MYLFRDKAGEVLYVGKAKSLRPRVRVGWLDAEGKDGRDRDRTVSRRRVARARQALHQRLASGPPIGDASAPTSDDTGARSVRRKREDP